jgi:hypothetical protein
MGRGWGDTINQGMDKDSEKENAMFDEKYWLF